MFSTMVCVRNHSRTCGSCLKEVGNEVGGGWTSGNSGWRDINILACVPLLCGLKTFLHELLWDTTL
jgi:hypothetical protein